MEVSRRMVNHETPCGRSYIVRAWWKISTALCEHRGGARWFIAYENRRTGDSLSAAIIEMDLRLRRSHQIIDPSSSILLSQFLLFSLSLEISNGVGNSLNLQRIHPPILWIIVSRIFFLSSYLFVKILKKNSRLTRYRSIKGLRHAPSPPSSPITITRSKTRISLKSLRIVRRVGGEERGKVWGRERGALYETKPHYCKW